LQNTIKQVTHFFLLSFFVVASVVSNQPDDSFACYRAFVVTQGFCVLVCDTLRIVSQGEGLTNVVLRCRCGQRTFPVGQKWIPLLLDAANNGKPWIALFPDADNKGKPRPKTREFVCPLSLHWNLGV
jgi:hypothetical protein